MLEHYRQQIDDIDNQILSLLVERSQISKKIWAYKKQNKLPIYQPERREQLLINRQKQATKIWLSPDFIKDIRNLIHKESLNLQQQNG